MEGDCWIIAGVILSPQRPQKREFAGSGDEHRGHGKVPGGASPGLTRTNERLPHRPQNRTPSANLDLHWVHATMPGIMLDPAPLLVLPSDGDG